VVRLILAQIALALRGIHRNGIAHLDLKPDNILLDGVFQFRWDGIHYQVPRVRLADFGLAARVGKKLVPGGKRSIFPKIAAPEVWNADISTESDWWSFGALAAQLVVPPRYHEKGVDVSFAPGDPGIIVANWEENPIVTKFKENSQEEKLGVKVGHKITKIDGKPYNKELMVDKMMGKSPYRVEFEGFSKGYPKGIKGTQQKYDDMFKFLMEDVDALAQGGDDFFSLLTDLITKYLFKDRCPQGLERDTIICRTQDGGTSPRITNGSGGGSCPGGTKEEYVSCRFSSFAQGNDDFINGFWQHPFWRPSREEENSVKWAKAKGKKFWASRHKSLKWEKLAQAAFEV